MADYSLWPSILPDRDDPFVDDSYSRAELERMEWADLRAIAAEHPSEAVDGKSDRETIEAELTGAKRV